MQMSDQKVEKEAAKGPDDLSQGEKADDLRGRKVSYGDRMAAKLRDRRNMRKIKK